MGFVSERSSWPERTPARGREARVELLCGPLLRKLEVRAALWCCGGRETLMPSKGEVGWSLEQAAATGCPF